MTGGSPERVVLSRSDGEDKIQQWPVVAIEPGRQRGRREPNRDERCARAAPIGRAGSGTISRSSLLSWATSGCCAEGSPDGDRKVGRGCRCRGMSQMRRVGAPGCERSGNGSCSPRKIWPPGRQGVDARTIRDIETGRTARPRPSTVRLLTEALAGPPSPRATPRPVRTRRRSGRRPSCRPTWRAFTGRAAQLGGSTACWSGAGNRPTAVVISAIVRHRRGGQDRAGRALGASGRATGSRTGSCTSTCAATTRTSR